MMICSWILTIFRMRDNSRCLKIIILSIYNRIHYNWCWIVYCLGFIYQTKIMLTNKTKNDTLWFIIFRYQLINLPIELHYDVDMILNLPGYSLSLFNVIVSFSSISLLHFPLLVSSVYSSVYNSLSLYKGVVMQSSKAQYLSK